MPDPAGPALSPSLLERSLHVTSTPEATVVVGLYVDEQLSIRAIADRTGLSYRKVRQQLIDARVTFRANTRRPETDALAEDFATLYRRGLSLRKIVKETGYSYRYIHALLTEAGVTLRDFAGEPRKVTA